MPEVRRISSGALLGLLALAAVLANDTVRSGEAALFAPLVGLVTGAHGAVTAGSIVWFARGTSSVFGLDVTHECTTAVLAVPLLVIMAGFAAFSRIPLARIAGAASIGLGLLVLCNMLRVAGIAWATWLWGVQPGYEYSHVFVGTAFALLGFVLSLAVSLGVLVRGRHGRPGRDAADSAAATGSAAEPGVPRPAPLPIPVEKPTVEVPTDRPAGGRHRR